MKIISSTQLKELDKYTIAKEPVASIDLMERAAEELTRAITHRWDTSFHIAVFAGPEFDGHLVNFDEAMKRQQMYKTQEGRAMLKLQEGDTHHGGCGHCGGDE